MEKKRYEVGVVKSVKKNSINFVSCLQYKIYQPMKGIRERGNIIESYQMISSESQTKEADVNRGIRVTVCAKLVLALGRAAQDTGVGYKKKYFCE